MTLTETQRQAIKDMVATWPALTQDQQDGLRLAFTVPKPQAAASAARAAA